MKKTADDLWNKPSTAQIARVLAIITDEKTMRLFLRDVMTEKEVNEIGARFEAARMLRAGATYVTIVEQTKLSSRTVARISAWLQNGYKGYDAALKTLDK